MLGVYVSVPVACFRKGLAREYLETEALPPPATCYGFLLSLVGETDRRRHVGCRVAPVLLKSTAGSVVLRTVWRVKDREFAPGTGTNARPDYQQLLTGVELVIWLDSSEEAGESKLEGRVRAALADPAGISRFGGLSLGESTHLVDEVLPVERAAGRTGQAFLIAPKGRLTLPVWVDHVGSAGTRFATGDLTEWSAATAPDVRRLPLISPV